MMSLMKHKTYRELNKALAQQALREVRRTWAWKGIWLALGGAAAYRAAVDSWGSELILSGFFLIVIALLPVLWQVIKALPYIIAEMGAAYVWARTLREDRER